MAKKCMYCGDQTSELYNYSCNDSGARLFRGYGVPSSSILLLCMTCLEAANYTDCLRQEKGVDKEQPCSKYL